MISKRQTSTAQQFKRADLPLDVTALETRPERALSMGQAPDIAEQATTLIPSLRGDLDIAEQATRRMPTTAVAVAEPAWSHSSGPGAMPSTPLLPPVSVISKRKSSVRKKRGKKRVRLSLTICSLIVIFAVVFLSQGNGTGGAWLADMLRGILGPTATAQVESWYLNLTNTATQVQYQLGNKKVSAPWKGTQATPSPLPTRPAWATVSPMTLISMTPLTNPALSGEGAWTMLDQAPKPYDYLPLDAKAYIRPDPSHPYSIVTMLQFDTRFALLHIVSGTVEPGGPRGVSGPGVIPTADQQGNALLGALNGGFKYADGQYGLMANGVMYVPPVFGVATIAITKKGKLLLGAWGLNPLLSSQNTDLVAWRQNAALLIDHGVINPLTHDGAAWGGTILNSSYTWRSAIGIKADGTFIYAAGNALTAKTLGEAMKAAGVVMAMQTDINPFWVRAFLYDRDQKKQLSVTKLNPQMQGTGYEYLNGMQRDFFYLTRYAPKTPPTNGKG